MDVDVIIQHGERMCVQKGSIISFRELVLCPIKHIPELSPATVRSGAAALLCRRLCLYLHCLGCGDIQRGSRRVAASPVLVCFT